MVDAEGVGFISGIVAGFLAGLALAGRNEGDRGILGVYVNYRKYTFHLHHWFFSTVVLFVLIYQHSYNPFVYGFFIGNILHGLKYRDYYTFIHKLK